MIDELAAPQTCAVKDLNVGDQIQIKDFDGPRVVRGGTKISADTMELKLEDCNGHIDVADFKLNEEVTVIAKKVKKAAKGETKKAAKNAGAGKTKEKAPPKAPAARARPAEPTKVAQDPGAKKMSALDAAAKVLAEAGEAMNCQEMIKAMAEKSYWTSPGGKTPHATLYSAILRDLQTKGDGARFQKTERGKFVANRTV